MYDYVSKYCQTCMIQAHNKEQCYVVHPKLYPKERTGKEGDIQKDKNEEEFVEQRNKNGRGGRNRQQEKVWTKVGITIGNKFNMLKQGSQELDEELEKGNETEKRINKVNKEDTPEVQMSDNKEKKTKEQLSTKKADPVENNMEEMPTNNNKWEASQAREEERSENANRNLFGMSKGAPSKNNLNNIDEPDLVARTEPDLLEETEKILQFQKETEKDEDMEFNIQQISKAGDFSPRHTNSLKNGTKKGRQLIPWQNIRSVNTQKYFERLLDLNRRHHYSFIILMEPFQNSSELEQYKRKLGFDNAGVGEMSGKIVGRDFNVILNEEEKLGGLTFTQNEAMDFASFISNSALVEVRCT
ncbi:hypothetical protein H5410_047183 [Solanum commersonii]|uniref:Uncharacterized protein n=1 Tax=Solanum commersonii TaxID=4109 RepID=A0A9J5XGD2_SOLCO|nr:hypothetical protein H5410_047183 [Solanum commersonii]